MKWFEVENRMTAILKELEQRDRVSVDALAEKLGVSTKTVQNDIKAINERMDGCGVIDHQRGVYKLYVVKGEAYNRVRNDIEKESSCFDSPQMRMCFIVETLMTDDTPYLIDELAYTMNVGRTTLMADLRRLKEILALYDLKIQGKPNSGIRLRGDEINLRLFVLENAYSVLYDEKPLAPEIETLVRERFTPFHLDAMAIDYFLQFLTIVMDRFFTGHPAVLADEKYRKIEEQRCFMIVDGIADDIGEQFGKALTRDERCFLAIPLAGMRTPFDISGIENYVAFDSNLLRLVEDILARIREEMGLQVKITDDGTLESFIYHIYFMTNRLHFGFHLHNPMVDSMKEKFGVAYRMATLAREVIEAEENVRVPEDEVSFLAAYFEIFLGDQQKIQKGEYRVAVICGTGRATARLLLNQLERVFDSGTYLKICNDDSQLTAEYLDTFDLVISTVESPYETSAPTIHIGEIFDEESLAKNIDQIRYTMKLEIPLTRGIHSVLLSLVDDSTFFVGDPGLNYQDNLHDMIDILCDEGRVDPGFRQRLDEREARASMIFDESVAFPHGYQIQTDKPVVSIGVFPEPMTVGVARGIQVIFLVGLPKGQEDDVLLVNIYDEIIRIASDKEVVAAIAQCPSYQDFLMYFITKSHLFG